jgi:hypothetical protein
VETASCPANSYRTKSDGRLGAREGDMFQSTSISGASSQARISSDSASAASPTLILGILILKLGGFV